jgi:lysophospholipase
LPEQAPLISAPGAPAPEGGQAEWFSGAGGARLRAAIFPTGGAALGSVVVSPGRTEPIEKYFETVGDLNARGFAVLVHDWRGQGLSQRLLRDRLAGHAAGYKDFLADYQSLLDVFETRLPQPWIALGHSMGGCLTLLALATGEGRFSGAMLSSPMLGIATGTMPARAARALARLQTVFGRGGTAAQSSGNATAGPTPFEDNVLTHDRRRYERNLALFEACPDLALGGPTWGWVEFAFSAIGVLQRGPGTASIRIPVTIAAASDEKLVDNNGLRVVVGRLPGARLVEIPGAFHEILQETDEVRAMFWREFDALVARSGVTYSL